MQTAIPFLKWAGGKRRLLAQYQPYFPPENDIERYFEPFIGSAAVFFHLRPANAHLADVNHKLVEVYAIVQKRVGELIQALGRHRNDRDYYYQIRAQDPSQLDPVERAARLIYLNRTCYNGLYRENRSGRFNVPFGRYQNPTICDPERLKRASAALQGVTLQVADFEEVVVDARPGDFVYFDPPYAPLNATSNFTSYNRHGFGLKDQRRLARVFHDLSGRGCRVMLSNSSAPLIRELYQHGRTQLIPIQARRSINSKGHKRGPVQELLIINYEPRSSSS